MKKIIFRTIVVLITTSLLILSLSGCDSHDSSKDTPPTSVAIVLGNHANSYALNLSNPDLVSDVAEATADGFVSVINCDGKPYIVSADLYSVPEQYRSAAPEKLEADAKQRAAKILSSLTSVTAQTPELNTLEALSLAIRALKSAPEGSRKIIYALDTGLSTIGLLDFRNNLLDADPSDIASELAERSAIPDFSGITVKWQQMGDIASPQQPLSQSQVQKLHSIWNAIIEKSGGKMEISDVPPGQEINESEQFPEISLVDLPSEEPITFETNSTTAEKESASAFTEKRLEFVADTAKYLDEEKAESTLKPVAEYMIANSDFTGLLVGTTATGDKDFCLKLSEDRASAIRNSLITLGVPEDRLIAIGLGCDDPWHVEDTDENGNLIENLARKNRKVLLLDANSKAAKAILDNP